MYQSIAERMWGHFENRDELRKFVLLAIIFACTIGVYWIINSIKDALFFRTVGKEYLPYAKWCSIVFLIPLIILYGRLVDRFPRHRIFYVVCTLYSLFAFVFAYFVHYHVLIITLPLSPYRLLGWAWYSFVESFGSLMVVLFWSFATDTTTPESAKRGFSIVAMGAQCGGVLGPLFFSLTTCWWGPTLVICGAACGMLFIALLVKYFMLTVPTEQLSGFNEKGRIAPRDRAKTGFFEGICFLFSCKYLLGILAIVSLYEIVVTVIEFHFKILVGDLFGSLADLTTFFLRYAVCINGIAFLSLLFGAGAIGRVLGLAKTLLLLPFLVSIGIVVVYVYPQAYVVGAVLMVIKGLNFALNQPAKEQLYIPTSRTSRYKVKAWVDMFGLRLSKGLGFSVHMLQPMLNSLFMIVSSGICFGLIFLWTFAAIVVSQIHRKAVESEEIVC